MLGGGLRIRKACAAQGESFGLEGFKKPIKKSVDRQALKGHFGSAPELFRVQKAIEGVGVSFGMFALVQTVLNSRRGGTSQFRGFAEARIKVPGCSDSHRITSLSRLPLYLAKRLYTLLVPV